MMCLVLFGVFDLCFGVDHIVGQKSTRESFSEEIQSHVQLGRDMGKLRFLVILLYFSTVGI
jgi:hypothetical protein